MTENFAVRDCTLGKWSKPGIPHRDWTCVGMEDLGAWESMDDPGPSTNYAICEMCEHARIRFVHEMTHPEYPGTLRVGVICAGEMERDYKTASSRETEFKKRVARRRTWLRRKWKLVEATRYTLSFWMLRVKGRELHAMRFLDGYFVVMTRCHGLPCGDRSGVFPTLREAQLSGFNLVEKRTSSFELCALRQGVFPEKGN